VSKVARGGIHFIIVQVIGLLAGVLLQRVLALYLSPEGYGAYGLVVSFTVVVSTVLTAGVPQAASRFLATSEGKTHQLRTRFLGLQERLTIVVFIAYLVVSPFVAALLLPAGQEAVIIIAVLYIPVESINILYFNFLNGLKEYHKQGNARLVYFTAKALIAIFLVILGFQLFGAMAGFVMGSAFSLLVEYYYWKKASGHLEDNGSEYSGSFFSDVMLFSVPLIVYSTLNLILSSIDVFIIKALLGYYESGIYYAAKNIAQLPFQVLVAAAVVLFPAMSSVHENKVSGEFMHYGRMTLRYLFLLIMPCILFMVQFSQELILLIYNTDYLLGNESLQLLSIAYLVGVGTSFVMTLLISTGHTGDIIVSIVVSIIAHFLGCIFLIPILGIAGAGISWVIASTIMFVIMAGVLTRREGRIIPGLSLAKAIIGLGLAIVVNQFFTSMNLYLSFLLSIVVYFAIVILLKALTIQDIRYILRSIL
jgi:O-antigen/teichoic acid export membrane protein